MPSRLLRSHTFLFPKVHTAVLKSTHLFLLASKLNCQRNEIIKSWLRSLLLSSFVARFLGNKKTVSTRCNLLRAHQGPLKNHKNNHRFFSLEHEKNHTKRSQKLYKTSCSAGLSDVFLIFQPLFMVLSGMGIIFERPPSQELSRRFRKPGHTAPLSTSSTTGTQQLRKFERLAC